MLSQFSFASSRSFRRGVFAAALTLAATRAAACDLCSGYSANDADDLARLGWSFSVATQFTHFATLRDRGDKVFDPAAQRLDSAITQTVASYRFTDRFAVQLNLPFIQRSFRRPDGFAVERGHESGVGDASLFARGTVLRRDSEKFSLGVNLLAGVKFATGSTRRIAEEFSETEFPGAPASGVHGHDLTLGSGSTDALFGTQAFARAGRLFATASGQYTARRTGRYDYRFANDLTWEFAPGVRFELTPDRTLALQTVVSGEHKGMDTLAGAVADDTGITTVYAGPRLTYAHANKFRADLGLDLPVRLDNTALQLTPDYKLRASMTWGF